MIFHPIILIPKLFVLVVISLTLAVLHTTLDPEQFQQAVVIGVVVFLGFTIALWIFAARSLRNPESRLAKAMVLTQQAKSEDGFTTAPQTDESLVDRRGVAISNLNPAGNALVDERRIPVVTEGQYVEADSPIEVVEASGSRVVVKGV